MVTEMETALFQGERSQTVLCKRHEGEIVVLICAILSGSHGPVYTRRQIKNDQPGSHDFRRFLRQFWTDFLEIV